MNYGLKLLTNKMLAIQRVFCYYNFGPGPVIYAVKCCLWRKRGRVDECTGLENRSRCKTTGGSNPPASAIQRKYHSGIRVNNNQKTAEWPLFGLSLEISYARFAR